jgi:hypothetical protein
LGRISVFIRRLSPFWLVVFMVLVGIMIYAVTVPIHELGHILIGTAYGQRLVRVEWFNATAWVQGMAFGTSGADGWVVMTPMGTIQAAKQVAFVQLTLYHGLWNLGMLTVAIYTESRILKVWKGGAN